MTSTPRILLTSLAALALAAPAASALPVRDHVGTQASSLAGSSARQQDLRHLRAGGLAAPKQDLRNPDNRAPRFVAPIAPIPVQQSPYTPAQLKPIATPVQVASDDSPSPFVYIIPGVVLIAMLGAGIAFARTSRPARRSAA